MKKGAALRNRPEGDQVMSTCEISHHHETGFHTNGSLTDLRSLWQAALRSLQ
jgi:hypothetical protein